MALFKIKGNSSPKFIGSYEKSTVKKINNHKNQLIIQKFMANSMQNIPGCHKIQRIFPYFMAFK